MRLTAMADTFLARQIHPDMIGLDVGIAEGRSAGAPERACPVIRSPAGGIVAERGAGMSNSMDEPGCANRQEATNVFS